MYTFTEPGQVNAIGFDEKIVRVKVPEVSEDQEEGPRPQLVNFQLEPTKTKIADSGSSSTVSDSDHYNTYWVSDSDLHGATDRAMEADTDVVLIDSDRPLAAVQKSSVDKRLWLVVEGKEKEDEGDDGYNGRSGNRYDDVNRLQSMRPPLPVQSSSARPGNHSPSGVTRAVQILCLLPFSYYVAHILS